MTLVEERPAPGEARSSITAGKLGRNGMISIVVAAVALGALAWLPTGSVNWARWP